MNFRKTVRSTYQHQSQHQSLKKIDFNPDDLKECNNLYNEQAQSTKQSESNSILNRLLLQPPSMKQNSQKKLSLMQNKKYEQKFQKPDVQNVIQENINLKNIIQSNNHAISSLKVKNIQLQKKIKLLQRGLQKFEMRTQVQRREKNSQQDEKQENQNDRKGWIGNSNEQRKLGQTVGNSTFSKTGTVHTQILKKKISQLTQLNISAENQLKFLKKLPNITIYEQNDLQKQHLMAETIRLKSIITSLSQELHQMNQNELNEKFQNQFMRLMKQQNEKLKATVRLLQNDKILLKSRQAIMNKLNSDLKKEIEQLKSKLLYKQSQLQKINNENKNLLFKKTNQYRLQQEKKQSEIILQLRKKLSTAQSQIVKLQQSNEFLNEENISLKEKQKMLQQQLSQLETKYQSLIKKLNDQNDELQFELKNVKNDYLNLMNANSLKKKKSVAILMQPNASTSNGNNMAKRDSAFSLNINNNGGGTNKNGTQFQQQYQSQFQQNNSSNNSSKMNSLLKRQKSLNQYHYLTGKSLTYARSVKWDEIQLPLTHLYVTFQQHQLQSIDTILQNISQDNKIKCGDLITLFNEQPFNISKKQATKLARYIVEEQSTQNQRVVYDENTTATIQMAKIIILSSLQKIDQKLSQRQNQRWKAIFDKTKKLISLLKQWLQDKNFVKKEEIMQLIEIYSRQKVQIQDYDFLCTRCFDKTHSEDEFTLSKTKILQWMDILLKPQHKEQQFYNNIIIE